MSKKSQTGKSDAISGDGYSKVTLVEEDIIRKNLKKISVNARRRAYGRKGYVTVVRNGKILRLYPNRVKRSVGKVRNNSLKIDISKPFKIL